MTRAILLAYDSDAMAATAVDLESGEELSLSDVLVDDSSPLPEVNDEIEIEADDGITLIRATGRRGHLGLSPYKGSVPVGTGERVQVAGLLAGLNTAHWTALGLSDRWVVIDEHATLVHVSGIGDGDAVLEEIVRSQAADASKAAEREKERASEDELVEAHDHRGDRARLVNPYSFAPLATDPPERVAPSGHDRIVPGNLSGHIDVTWELLAPLLNQEAGADGSRFFRDDDGQPCVPGSSVKGAIRSLHEAMSGSCLRVLDQDFVPVYREPPERIATGNWMLALVGEADGDGRPTIFRVCDETVWIRHDVLVNDLEMAKRHTGARLKLSGDRVAGPNGRSEVRASKSVSADDRGEWILMLSDAGARPRGRDVKGVWHPGNYFASAGHLSGRTVPGCTDKAWETYGQVVRDAKDVRQRRGNRKPDLKVIYERSLEKNGRRDHVEIGRRQEVTAGLAVGRVVWVLVEGDAVVAIKQSQAWRMHGSGSLAERVPEGWHACRGDDEIDGLPALCPACRLFGSADTAGGDESDDRRAHQRSYRGHVRISTARFVEGAPLVRQLERAALSSPRPGSGQFYLTPGPRTTEREDRTQPLSQWGSRADTAEKRQIRGRKFYWHGLNGRHSAQGGNDTLVETVEVVAEGASLSVKVTFDNLPPAMVGGLIASLRPELALESYRRTGGKGFDAGRIAARLGGGRPLGFGTVAVTSLQLDLHDQESRYRDGAKPQATATQLVEEFVQSVPESVKAGSWPALAALLSTTWVEPGQIRYPDLKFFKESSGTRAPMVSLPSADRFDQTLPADPRRDRT